MWRFRVVVLQEISAGNCCKVRAARAACFFFVIQPNTKKKSCKGNFPKKIFVHSNEQRKKKRSSPLSTFFSYILLTYSPSKDSNHPDDLFQSRYVTPGFKPFSYILLMYAWIEIALKKKSTYSSSINFFFWLGTLFRLHSQRWKLPSSYCCSSRAFSYICCQKACKKKVHLTFPKVLWRVLNSRFPWLKTFRK